MNSGRISPWGRGSWVLAGLVCCHAALASVSGIPPLSKDFLSRALIEGDHFRLTLPDGRPVLGKLLQSRRSDDGTILSASGTILHPSEGEFRFDSSADTKEAPLSGVIRLFAEPVRWELKTAPENQGYVLAKTPEEDAFRPRNPKMPESAAIPASASMSRAEAEEQLRRGLRIEKTAPGKLRVGLVEIDQLSRSVRFPATVNMTRGTIEYAVVTRSGKVHEALFSTDASPRDIHMAMLLLGTKPSPCEAAPDRTLRVPEEAAVRIHIEWNPDGTLRKQLLGNLLATGSPATPRSTTPETPWLYNGSRFNKAGFAAITEGSIVSLVADDLALVNNPMADRSDDEVHLPNESTLPATGTQVTVVIARVADLPSPP